MTHMILPTLAGELIRYRMSDPGDWWNDIGPAPKPARVFYAAAHVSIDAMADCDPWATDKGAPIDWETTLATRAELFDLGFHVAEAMDTAQRGGGLDWSTARQLIARSANHAQGLGRLGQLACGVGTDQLAAGRPHTIDDVIVAYEEQLAYVEATGARAIIMASRALASAAKSPEDYVRVYEHVLGAATKPVILHWLGEMFDPALRNYWGTPDVECASEVLLRIISAQHGQIDGVKISLLSAPLEIALRRRLPSDVRMYTGDDFNFAELIGGDSEGFSHALLGIFSAIAPAASAALKALSEDDTERFHAILAPTVPFSRHLFAAPTRFYKTGIVFMNYLSGGQSHFAMLGGQQSARSVVHLCELFRLADAAGLFRDPEFSARRMSTFLLLHGVEQTGRAR